jgi:large subunit ribosomal protein L17
MRHGNKINHLGRKTGHRAALLRNLAIALFTHKRITTTLAKAKELRTFVEPLITKAKDNATHNRRMVFSSLQNKEAVKELFDVISAKVGDRPGGYTRILRTGFRLGDAAETCFIELVDFNEAMLKTNVVADKKRTRRSRGAGKDATTTAAVEPVVEAAEETQAAAEEAQD